MSPIGVVLRKELVDGLRDRRSLFSLLLFPLVGPLMIALVMTQAAEQAVGEDVTKLPVKGVEHAPNLIRYLERHDIEVVDPPDDPIAAVQDRVVDAVLIIPPDYGERFRAGKPATVELVIDESRTEASATVRRVDRLIQAHAKAVGTLRLLAHGVSHDLVEPIKIQRVDLSTPKKRAAVFLNMIPMFALLALFIGGMYTAMDSTAGERERGSMEPLLITPVARRSLILGKWLTAVIFSVTTVLITFAFSLVAVGQVPADKLGVNVSFSAMDIAGVLIATLPLSLFVASVQMLVASFARTLKEAQTYLSLLIFVPMVPGMLTTLSPFKTELWMTLVPVFGQQVLIGDVIRGEPAPMIGFGLAALASVLGAALCVTLTAKLFERERIIFGR